MTKRHLFSAIALCLGVVALFNVFLAFDLDSFPRQIIRDLKRQPKIDMLFLGNSLMNRALDENTFRDSWPGPSSPPALFNACLPASGPVEHYLFAREAFRDHPSIKYVVYDIYDRQLTETPEGGWNQLVGGMAMAYYVEPDLAKLLYFPDSVYDQLRFRLVSFLPMLSERFSLWQHIENQRRRMAQVGMPPIANKGALVSDFHELGYPEKIKFMQDCDNAVKNSADFTPALDHLFNLASTEGARIFVVDMPMQANHREFYYSSSTWLRYRSYLKDKLKARGITFIDATDWAQDADFLDDIHLNDGGAKKFSSRLSAALDQEINH
jgi:hypothetical protein